MEKKDDENDGNSLSQVRIHRENSYMEFVSIYMDYNGKSYREFVLIENSWRFTMYRRQ